MLGKGLAILVALSMLSVSGLATAAQSLPTNYAYQRTITIDHTQVPNTDQSNFPVLISGTYPFLATTANGGSVSNANGYDIFFTSDAAGTTPLAFERESYNAAPGAVTFWVKIPTLSHTSDTQIYVFYGNPTVTADSSNPSAVWDSNYVGVWHLADNAANTVVQDSTSHDNGTAAANTNTKSVAGAVGSALSFSGTDDVTTGLYGTTASTWETWFYTTTNNDFRFHSILTIDGSNYLLMDLYGLSGSFWSADGMYGTDLGVTGLSPNTWYHLVLVRSGDNVSGTGYMAYLNGTLTGQASSGTLNGGNTITMGYRPDASSQSWNGNLDEVRVSNSGRTADWISTSYKNESSPATFYSVGVQTVPSITLDSIAVTPSAPLVAYGLTQQFTAIGTYSNGSTQNVSSSVTWNSATTSVAAINSSGSATALGTGSSVITATSGTISGATTMTVIVPTLVSIAVTPGSASIANGLTQQFTAIGTYSDGSTQNVSSSVIWSSATASVATINSSGLATALGTGNSVITATSGVISCATTLTVTAPSAGYNSQRAITIDHTQVPNTDQSNFPVLISGTYPFLATTANGGSVSNANGYDIFFTSDAAGTTPLAFERESYNAAPGAVTFWVKIPTLSHTSDTQIYVFYGNPTVTADSSNPSAVWDSNYVGVWHLADNAANTVVQDSTSHDNGTAAANTNTKSVAGAVGSALSFSGTDDVTTGLYGTTASTWETWFYTTTNNDFRFHSILTIDGSNYLLMDLYGLSGSFWSADGMYGTDLGVTGLSPNTWYHLVLVRSGDNVSGTGYMAYLNGTLTGQASSGTLNGGNTITMGYRPDASSQSWNGNLDEVRVSNSGRTADWISTSYKNESSPATFYSVGPKMVPPPVIVSIAVTPSNSIVAYGLMQQFSAIGTYSDGSTQNLSSSVTWSSTPASVATINSSGLASTLDAGTSQVTASSSGVTSNATTLTVVVDNQPPTGSVIIDGGASTTTSLSSTLTLSAIDNLSGVTQMRFSNTGSSYSPTQAFAPTASWTLSSGAGTKTVYVEFQDGVGNWSGAFTSSIVYQDIEPPTVPTNLQISGTALNSITLAWVASTDNVGVVGYKIYRNSVLVNTSATTSYADTGLAPGTSYTYAVSAYDAAGNESAQSTSVSGATTLPPFPTYPVKASANGRYLVDQYNRPFLMTGDSPQQLMVLLSEAQADSYFADRKAAGFNAVWIDLISNYQGTNGATYDGIAPFTTTNNLATPNEAYFSRADDMIRLAAKYGITVILFPSETTHWLSALQSNGATVDYAYGQYVGNRYKNFDNIIWGYGNDFETWQTPSDDAVAQAVAQGVKSVDTRHISTVELNYFVSGSLDDPTWAPLIQLDLAYSYFPTYAEVLQEYNRSNFMPVFMAEANYEFESLHGDTGTPAILRRQEYWTLLSGATGQLYGNHYTWQFLSGWQSFLDTPGSIQMGYVNNLFTPRRWYALIPDQNHTVVTSGYGTFSSTSTLSANDYVTAASIHDGTLVLAYMPTARTITVDMTNLASPAVARWYDPTNGLYTGIAGSPFNNTGTMQFTPPSTNSAGDSDWVLVLEAAPDTQTPSTPANLSAVAVASFQVNLAWGASTDNDAIAGYRIYRNNTQVGTTTGLTFADMGLTPQTSYTYTVSSVDSWGNNSATSLPALVTTPVPDTTPPTVPTSVQSSNIASNSVTISWSPSTDPDGPVEGYRIFRNGTAINTTSGLSFSDSGLSASTTYSYAVVAFDYSNNASAPSQSLSVTTPAPPVPPAFVQAGRNLVVNGSAVSVAFPAANRAGSLVVAYVVWGSTTSVTVTDSQGNAYLSAGAPIAWGTNQSAQAFYAKNVVAGSNTVTATFRSQVSSSSLLYVQEYSGVSAVSPLDASATAAGGSSGSLSATLTTLASNDLILAMAVSSNTITAVSSGYTTLDSNFGNLIEERTAATPGSYTATMTQNGSAWVVEMLAFRAP